MTVTRALLLGGERKPAGARLELPALQAAELLESGRAVLVNESDMPAVAGARRANVAALLRRQHAPDPGSPWLPMR